MLHAALLLLVVLVMLLRLLCQLLPEIFSQHHFSNKRDLNAATEYLALAYC